MEKSFFRADVIGLRAEGNNNFSPQPYNISLNSGRKGTGEYMQFLHIALGSARELDTQLIISLRVELAKPEYIKSVLNDCDEMQKLLKSTINTIKDK